MSSINRFQGNLVEKEIRQRTKSTIENKMIPLFSRRTLVRRQISSIQRILIILIVITFLFIVYSSISLSPLVRLIDPYSYVIVLDAGSTGTRIHVYKFQSSLDNDNLETFILKNEIFEEKKPGLSSFADNVIQAESQIDELLNIADREVSRFKHRSTPIVLRATAGLRLLEEQKQRRIIETVSKSFSKYGFYRPSMDIAIMNETEEGIDAWLTLVYLKGEQFYGSRIAALDLGGGSTQITYNPSLSKTSLAEKLNLLLKVQQPIEPGEIKAFRDPNSAMKNQMPRIDVGQADLKEIEPVQVLKLEHSQSSSQNSNDQSIISNMQRFRMFGRDIHLYSKSYLGYGLMIARQQLFLNETIDIQMRKNHQLITKCFPKGIQGKFKFQDVTWNVQSQTDINDDQRFYSCLSMIDQYLSNNIQTAIGLEQMSIYVFSYFYDIADDAGLLQDDKTHSITTIFIRDLKQSAKSICGSTQNSVEHPFLCFDLTYIYSLLTKGYGLSEDIQINICKKIQQFEVAWSLGLALKLL